jgi:hypothetical protein
MGKILFAAAALLLAAAGSAVARDNAPPSDGTDAAFFLCMVEGGTEIPIPLVGTLCCNPDWCVLCDSDLNNCREITAAEGRRLQSPTIFQQVRPFQQELQLAPN